MNITIGTDVPQASKFAEFLNANGISASLAHTDIDYIDGAVVNPGTRENDIFQSRWIDFCEKKINARTEGKYVNFSYISASKLANK